MEKMKTTPLHQDHIDLGAKMVEFAGFHMPISYSSIKEEHEAVRRHVGMFDVSHMGEIVIEGNEAEAFVNYIFTNEVLTLQDGQINYGMLLYESGTVVDDLLVYKLNQNKYFLVVNASNIEKDYEHILLQAKGYDVSVQNQSDAFAEIAIQGPKTEMRLQEIFDIDLSDVRFFHFGYKKMNGHMFFISRTGYTGEDGFEIYGEPEEIVSLWRRFIQEGITPCGLGCRDTLRFEANLPLYGHEISDEITPVEAGLKYFVKLKTGEHFLG